MSIQQLVNQIMKRGLRNIPLKEKVRGENNHGKRTKEDYPKMPFGFQCFVCGVLILGASVNMLGSANASGRLRIIVTTDSKDNYCLYGDDGDLIECTSTDDAGTFDFDNTSEIDIGEEFKVCAEYYNKYISGKNGPESEPEYISFD